MSATLNLGTDGNWATKRRFFVSLQFRKWKL